jgi:hypothetical protein
MKNKSASTQPRTCLILPLFHKVQVSDVSDDMKMVTVVYALSKLIFRDQNGKQKSKCSKMTV